jgi:oxygen-dependent protoporphyrinogen oxidase
MVIRKKIVVIGGGISGLTTAWALQQKDPTALIFLVEKTARLGGWIYSQRVDNFLFEFGPRSCRSFGNGQATLKLVDMLGIKDQVVFGSEKANKKFLYLGGKLQEVPDGMKSLFLSPLFWKSTPALVREPFVPTSHVEDESIYDFVSRRFSPQVAETFFDPLISGIYAGNIRELSVKACFPFLKEWETKHGSVLKGMFAKKDKPEKKGDAKQPSIFSFKNGLETLTQALAERFKGTVLSGCEVTKIENHDQALRVYVGDKYIDADEVISTVPAQALGNILPHMKDLLSKQKKATVAVVSLGYKKKVLQKEGFGYLVPHKEQQRILGVVWDSSVFPGDENETRLSVMMGGTHFPNLTSCRPEYFIQEAKEGLIKHMGIHDKPDAVQCSFAYDAIPQYFVGHHAWVKEIEQSVQVFSPRLSILGSSFYGVAVNDCIAGALKAAFEKK